MADTHLPYSVSSGSPYALSRDYVASTLCSRKTADYQLDRI